MTDRAAEAAFTDPLTLRAWRSERRRMRTEIVLCALCFVAYVGLAAVLEDLGMRRFTLGVATVPVVLALMLWVVRLGVRREQLTRMRRVLQTYPWRDLPPIGEAHPAGQGYFRMPDPDRPEKRVQVAFSCLGRGRRWKRAVTEVRSTASVYAGDPRFACVVSTPAKLLTVRPQHEAARHPRVRPDAVSKAAWTLALTAGITEPPSNEEKFMRLLYTVRTRRGSRPPGR
ncbi:hypothetical protein NGF19_12225 [Streptomyces sp. RY43-2]|uniref:Integral membrane protein n=1 Tax=Streptomyces macrolidinus TaxID=2952607 RepID=A0ABT0ZD90_9ACTN|nr:hypothetical protein [Streptomyces macrolidinus]MCN9241547.1 hypothetical protein [Streptomyces macrolidinus]